MTLYINYSLLFCNYDLIQTKKQSIAAKQELKVLSRIRKKIEWQYINVIKIALEQSHSSEELIQKGIIFRNFSFLQKVRHGKNSFVIKE